MVLILKWMVLRESGVDGAERGTTKAVTVTGEVRHNTKGWCRRRRA